VRPEISAAKTAARNFGHFMISSSGVCVSQRNATEPTPDVAPIRPIYAGESHH
jgi:hypothetical protein